MQRIGQKVFISNLNIYLFYSSLRAKIEKLKQMQKVIGMGNALVDIIYQMPEDSWLNRFSLPKGSMQLVDMQFSNRIVKETEHLSQQIASGGSAANAIHGLANMGVPCGFIGKVGKDKMGEFFKMDLESNLICPHLFQSETSTGKAIALISPDSERTFATYLGAAVELSENDIHAGLFKGYDYFHIEGYLVQNHKLIEKAVKLAKESHLKVSLDLASYNVVAENLGFLQHIVKDYVDILFANEEEARVFTGLNPNEAVGAISEMCEIAVVKVGKKGSLIKKGQQLEKVGIIGIDALDTTGAGDLYAAGFLYGLIKEMPLSSCGKAGAILSGKVIEVIGAKIDKPRWDQIHKTIETLLT